MSGELFTGEQFDTSLNQYYLRARYYDQSAGRFTQMDTWAGNSQSPITLHKYLYANADPVLYVDPTGHMGNLAEVGTANTVFANLEFANVTRVGYIGFAANDAIYGAATSTQIGISVLRALGVGSLVSLLRSDSEDDNDPKRTVRVYHGSFNAGAIRVSGLSLDMGTTFVSRDIAAAQDAIGPHRYGIETAPDPGIVVSEIPEIDFNTLMLPYERPYNGFYPYLIKSTEIPLRNIIQIELFNQHIVR